MIYGTWKTVNFWKQCQNREDEDRIWISFGKKQLKIFMKATVIPSVNSLKEMLQV